VALAACNVVGAVVKTIGQHRLDKGFRHVFDIDHVVELITAVLDAHRLAAERIFDEAAAQGHSAMPHLLSRAIDAGEAQRREFHAIRVAVHLAQLFRGKLGDVIGFAGLLGVLFVQRAVARLADAAWGVAVDGTAAQKMNRVMPERRAASSIFAVPPALTVKARSGCWFISGSMNAAKWTIRSI
jgi:hypothetical protein